MLPSRARPKHWPSSSSRARPSTDSRTSSLCTASGARRAVQPVKSPMLAEDAAVSSWMRQVYGTSGNASDGTQLATLARFILPMSASLSVVCLRKALTHVKFQRLRNCLQGDPYTSRDFDFDLLFGSPRPIVVITVVSSRSSRVAARVRSRRPRLQDPQPRGGQKKNSTVKCLVDPEGHAEATVNAVITSAARASIVLANPRRPDLRKTKVANDWIPK
ncbi:hypothetical protein EXIGLDRAFT_697430 [Exidia glandulosa HHB12029]|uniref:Uncharacterized protein n=1 Tax=Exidia glandulosa HHB12029 TaxID=1314781 RepID=A0A165MYG6_EXIGL|nr:hypothetical protein EXIGLDRAFT_697430 [Exidia glandulosa HHB12029]